MYFVIREGHKINLRCIIELGHPLAVLSTYFDFVLITFTCMAFNKWKANQHLRIA